MSNNNQNTRGFAGKGYYIALILCAAAIGISGYLYYRNAEDAQPVLERPELQPTLSVEATEADIPAAAPADDGEDAVLSTEAAAQNVDGELKTTVPVSGETVADFAMDCLSYNETTRDWRVHNGMDIAAPAGTPVVAAADGTVYTVYEDDVMGTTVVIRHAGGYITTYASLSPEVSVQAGDGVTVGQTIGTVGNTALIETVMGEHVHFSVLHNDAAMDPAEFLGSGK